MKIITFCLILLLTFSVTLAQKQTAEYLKSRRIEKVINSQWTFNYFQGPGNNKGYEAPAFDDSRWKAVSIPHTWSTYETTGELHPFIKSVSESDDPYWWSGWGWYRKHFSVNREYSDRKIFIEFEGVQKFCRVWLNGKFLGEHKGGYGSFDFDLTQYVKPGEDNILAVAVNNRQKDEYKIPPMAAGKFDVYGGIYRDVKLVLTDKMYIPMQGSAIHEGGTFVTTPKVAEKEATARVRTWVKNDYPEKKSCTLISAIIDTVGNVFQVTKTSVDINPGDVFGFDQTFKPVKNPHLWSTDDPYLYSVKTQVMDGKTIVDEYSSPLGFRRYRWNYNDNSLVLNNKKVILHGGIRHQDYPWLGDAIPKWLTETDLTDMAVNLNFNFLRTANYPNDKYVYDLADKFGIVVAGEVPNIGDQDFSPEVQEQQMKEMIRRDRNHPGIMFWVMGEETNHPADSKYAIAEDTTRILAAWKVKDGSSGTFVKLTDKNLSMDELPVSSIRGWYNRDVKNLEPTVNLQSGTEENAAKMLGSNKGFGKGNIVNLKYDDHGSRQVFINSPLQNVSNDGAVDIYRIPKYAYYFWQANYSKNPMVFIRPHFWRSQYLGQQKDIIVNSNCDKVELLVNGEIKGTKIPSQSDFNSVTFNNITVEAGSLTAIGTRDGKTIKKEIVLAGKPAKLLITGSHRRIPADRASVAIIMADIVDTWGNHVYGAVNTIKWNVSGPAALVGPAIYESDLKKNQGPEGVGYTDMPVSNVIRSTGEKGVIHISVSAGELASGTFDITAEELISDNTVIPEPVLKDEGRMPVPRKTLKSSRLDEVPQEIKEATGEINLGNSDKPGYKIAIREYIRKENESADTSTVEFRTLVNVFSSLLSNNSGRIIADDYNFSIAHYNNCRLISKYINVTKLPQPFKDGLRKYYSDEVIIKGSEKNAGDEMNWLNWIPSGGTVVIVQDEKQPAGVKGVIYTRKIELSEIIAVVYPQFVNFSPEAKERALTFISKANPYIHPAQVNGQQAADNTDKQNISFVAEPGQPILIPLLKFLSE
jgi:beta-galactosidase